MFIQVANYQNKSLMLLKYLICFPNENVNTVFMKKVYKGKSNIIWNMKLRQIKRNWFNMRYH